MAYVPDIIAIYLSLVVVVTVVWVGVGIVLGRWLRSRRERGWVRPEEFEGHTIGWRRAVRGDKAPHETE